jgi:hypothetical protein
MIISRTARIALLASIQNCREHAGHDILSFSGFLNDAELGDHIMACFRELGEDSRRRALANAHNIVSEAA